MPIRIPNNLPAREVLESENIFVMTEARQNPSRFALCALDC